MGSPYLNSGESIILTTHRVNVNAVPYDVMLTTERIVLVDDRNTRFEPRIIPLSTILSVRGGKTPANEPVIILMFHTPVGEDGEQPVNLVFSQNQHENRKPERDEWVRSLIQLSISLHEKKTPAEVPAVPDVTGDAGLRPTVRHGIAPERVRPLSNVGDRQQVPAPVTIIPDEVGSNGEIPPPTAAGPALRNGEKTGTETALEEAAGPDFTPVHRLPSPPPAVPARIIVPQIIEELMPARNAGAPPAELRPVPARDIDHDALLRSIQTAVRSLTVTEERLLPHPPVPAADSDNDTRFRSIQSAVTSLTATEEHQQPQTTIPTEDSDNDALFRSIQNAVTSLTATEEHQQPQTTIPTEDSDNDALFRSIQSAVTSLTAIEEQQQSRTTVPDTIVAPADELPAVPEISSPRFTGAPETITAEPPAAMETGSVPYTALPEPAHKSPQAGLEKIPPENIVFTIPENAMRESSGHTATDGELQPAAAAAEALPALPPVPPAQEIRSRRTMLAYAMLLLLIILAGSGAVLLLQQGHEPMDIPVMPPLVAAQITTEPPVIVNTTAPVTPTPASPIPRTGVWVQVNSTAHYTGQVGNPEQLQQVSGTGDTFYKIRRSNGIVQATIQKQDNSGSLLFVGVYRNGTLISSRSVTSPMGSVLILIDPVTALPPGLTENDTSARNAATPIGRLINY